VGAPKLFVEAQFDDGVTKRVKVREGGNVLTLRRVKTPAPGGAVPILISTSGDRAVLDWKDPRINLKAVMRANESCREGTLQPAARMSRNRRRYAAWASSLLPVLLWWRIDPATDGR
jgi:hypothetical protein